MWRSQGAKNKPGKSQQNEEQIDSIIIGEKQQYNIVQKKDRGYYTPSPTILFNCSTL